ncbi:MAG: nucleotide sugar dehydrogenase [Candidatus Limivicinus sp.]|jgi:UDP-N-acetyl-D-galactosamine dehydrogenase
MICEELKAHKTKLAVTGLGYVGLPLAVAFSEEGLDVIGYNRSQGRIDMYRSGIDPTHEVGNEKIKNCRVDFTADPARLRECKFHVVAVPTPVDEGHVPDLSPVKNSTAVIGRNLAPGSIVVYESTVYPGVTEDICIPILEKESGLKCGKDFFVGYSPERINPGDEEHTLRNITKIVSGMDEYTLNEVAEVYSLIIDAGVYRASCIKVAEAAKVIENSQRDINIAFINELSKIFNRLGIDTNEVMDAACTKWNFLRYNPGLVGGHCIGVDPYYLTYRAEQVGYISEVIRAARHVNDSMGRYVAQAAIKQMVKAGRCGKNARVAILGFTFKEDCPDTRNTRVIDIVRELAEYDISPVVVDPWADKPDVYKEYGLQLAEESAVKDMDAVIIAVSHSKYRKITMREIDAMFAPGVKKVLVDVKGILNKKEYEDAGYLYWRL